MKQKLLTLALIFSLVFTMAACSKGEDKKDDQNISNEEKQEENQEEIGDTPEISKVEFSLDTEYSESDNQDFADFVKEQYMSSIESSYMTMHVYYLDPEAAGFDMDEVDVSFGKATTPETTAEDREYYGDLLTKLTEFDRTTLSRRQQDEYDALLWEISTVLKLEDEKFDYYEQIFAPPNSLDQNIISWMSTWEIRNEREAIEFVQLLDSLPEYVESSIEYAKIQQEKELLMTDFDTVIDSCDEIISTGMDSEIIKNILSQIDELDGVSENDKTQYKDDISAAFERSYLPIFTDIRNAMDEMRDGYNNEEGYAAFPNGAEYFEIMLNYSLGLLDTPCGDIVSDMNAISKDRMSELYEILGGENSEEILSGYLDEDTSTGYTDYKEILEDVKVKMLKDHPDVKDLQYNIEFASEEENLDEKNIAAYFLIPPLDGDHVQKMRVNPSTKDIGTIDSYVTITHEGFPGHMYQYAYMYEEIDSDYIKTLGVDGNVEGYAMYSEYSAADYFDDDILSSVIKIHNIDDKVAYLAYSIVDIGINYDGWSLDDTFDYFQENDYSLDMETTKEVYDYLRCCPATYEAYGYGYELIARLRAQAEDELGDKFDATEFNRSLLNAGPSPYNIVTRYIGEYVLAE